jgi:cytochrome c oxidase subunit 4
MATIHKKELSYMAIFGWLFVLTVVEIGVVFLPTARLLIGILLVGLALTKASLVALYYMHLKLERRTLTLIVITPLLLCTLLVVSLLPDLSAIPHKTSAPVPEASPQESTP